MRRYKWHRDNWDQSEHGERALGDCGSLLCAAIAHCDRDSDDGASMAKHATQSCGSLDLIDRELESRVVRRGKRQLHADAGHCGQHCH